MPNDILDPRILTSAPVRGEWNVDNETYHAHTDAISNSMLNDFRTSIPLYFGRYISKEMERPAPSKDMVVGSALHALILEGPSAFASGFAVAPECDKRTKEGKALFADFEAGCGSKQILTADQFELVENIVAGIGSNSTALELLSRPGKTEQSICWTHEDSGLPLKARLDRITADHSLIIDLKTTTDSRPLEWAKSAVNFGYHRQAAFYWNGVKEVYGTHPEFIFIVVSKAAPYECVVYRMASDFEALGTLEVQESLEQLALCAERDDWQGRYSNGVQELVPPRWAEFAGVIA